MLDLNHPLSQPIFAAAWAESVILSAARDMTIAARGERLRLRDRCVAAFAELRRLSHDHFADRQRIPAAIDDLERALARLAEMTGVPEDGPPAEYECPACGVALERRDKYGFPAPANPTDIYCSPCLDILMPPLETLRSGTDGFGTECI